VRNKLVSRPGRSLLLHRALRVVVAVVVLAIPVALGIRAILRPGPSTHRSATAAMGLSVVAMGLASLAEGAMRGRPGKHQ